MLEGNIYCHYPITIIILLIENTFPAGMLPPLVFAPTSPPSNTTTAEKKTWATKRQIRGNMDGNLISNI